MHSGRRGLWMPGDQLVLTLIPSKNVLLVAADLSLINAPISLFLIYEANESLLTPDCKKKNFVYGMGEPMY